jgi:carbonic anhydrase
MYKLVKGILDFRKKSLKDYQDRFGYLAMGQAPDSLFITCSDSRVVPNLFTSTHPGHLFVIRNAGNIIPPYSVTTSETASIEFAISQLPIENIIVCGHSNCGAMQAILQKNTDLTPSLKFWLNFGGQECACNTLEGLAKQNVLQQMQNLMTFPIIAKKVEAGVLKIWGWYFDVGSGEVFAYEDDQKDFVLLDETEGAAILRRLEALHEKVENLVTEKLDSTLK